MTSYLRMSVISDVLISATAFVDAGAVHGTTMRRWRGRGQRTFWPFGPMADALVFTKLVQMLRRDPAVASETSHQRVG